MARPRHKDPECLACHTLGLGAVLTDGAVAIRLSAVGCEACHGPAQRHAAQMKLRSSAGGDAPIPSRRETRSERSSLSAVTSETCTRCHMPGKSPTFSYEEYLSIELCTTLADAVAEATDPEEVYENSALVLTAMQANELPHFTTSEILEEMEGWVDQLALWAADELQEPQNTEEYEEALDNIAALSVQVKAARDSYSSDASEVRRSTQSGGMDFAKQLVMCAILGAGTGLTALGGLVAGKSIGMFAALTLTSAVGWWITGGISLLVCVLCIWWI